MVRRSLLLVAAVLGLALAGSVWAQDHMVLRKQVSAHPGELVLPIGTELDALQSARAQTSGTTIEVVPCTPVPCRPEWRLHGSLTVTSLSQAFRAANEASGGLPPARIVLDSRGGSALAGLDLAQVVLDWGVDTAVEDNGTCLSACVYILSAGRNRTIGKWALVGVHQLNTTRTKLPDAMAADDYLASEAGLTPMSQAEALNLVDQGTREVQRHTGRWITYLLDAGVSPAIVSYASMADQTIRHSHMYVLRYRCARALRLDAQVDDTPWQSDEIQAVCGSGA